MSKHKSTPTGVGGGGMADKVSRRKKNYEKASKAGGLTFGADLPIANATSIFDPTLCELAYRWFCPPQGRVLDPFAGGSVRGIVASRLFRRYVGIDLSKRQIEANRAQVEIADPDFEPTWLVGDSRLVVPKLGPEPFDFIFSCPPYVDLERYSDDPADISTMGYADFLRAYREIVAACVDRLANNRFACFVVGDVRGVDGCYYGFPWHTVQAFTDAGMKLYNEGVLVTMTGSLPVRAKAAFTSSRKLGKTHQNVFVFVKGDPIKATKEIGDVDFSDGDADPMKDESDV